MISNQPDSDFSTNPFATRFTRPGALPFVYQPDWNAERIIGQWDEHHGRGAIVGPHGSGKSTLLAELAVALSAAGRKPVLYVMHAGERSWKRRDEELWDQTTAVLLDGYEQLSWFSKRRLKETCRRSHAGLLATSHTPVRGLPTLYHTSTDLRLAKRVMEKLLADDSTTIPEETLAAAFAECGGNLREVWFKLFDVYQKRN